MMFHKEAINAVLERYSQLEDKYFPSPTPPKCESQLTGPFKRNQKPVSISCAENLNKNQIITWANIIKQIACKAGDV